MRRPKRRHRVFRVTISSAVNVCANATLLQTAGTVPPQFRDQLRAFAEKQQQGFVRRFFAVWYIFDRDKDRDEDHGPQRFSLLYLCADGIAAYQELYWQNHAAPEVLAIIQPGPTDSADTMPIPRTLTAFSPG
jgi:hypothetical protein